MGITVRERRRLDEQVHRGTVGALVREWRCLEGDGPPIAVERSFRASGPHRPPVLLVHGLAQNRFTWRVDGRSFCAWLALRGYDVHNVELRGHGRSREWGAPSAERFEDYVDDLVRVVHTLEEPPFLIGHSLGAGVSLGAAAQVPVRGIVHLAGVYTFARHNAALRALARFTLAWEPALRRAPLRVRTQFAGRVIAQLYQLTDVAGYGAPIAGWAPDSMERQLLEARLELGFDWTSIEVWLEMSRWALGEEAPFAASFRALDRPILVAAGDVDPLVKPEDAQLTYAASGSSDKELVVFDAFDHEVHWGHIDLILGRRAPDHVWPRIGSWLDRRA